MNILGKKVKKINSELGDSHEDGAIGYSIGKAPNADKMNRTIHFVIWEKSDFPVAVASHRVQSMGEEKDIKIPGKVIPYVKSLTNAKFLVLNKNKND